MCEWEAGEELFPSHSDELRMEIFTNELHAIFRVQEGRLDKSGARSLSGVEWSGVEWSGNEWKGH